MSALWLHAAGAESFTVLNQHAYRQTMRDSRQAIKAHLDALSTLRDQDANQQIAVIVDQLHDIPYRFSGAMGEGDWQSASLTYSPGAAHIDQDPVYRLDGLDCQTFVQMTMALLNSRQLNDFDGNYVKIAYGAANVNQPDLIHYYNRNHFVDADFNPVNEQRGFLRDVTTTGVLAQYAKKTGATISRTGWLAMQRLQAGKYVRVLNEADGKSMFKRFTSDYQLLKGPAFRDQHVSMTYLPKESLALRSDDGYQPNEGLLDLIPTPAIAEIVCDADKWTIGGELIKNVIGTEMSVSHFGVLYRKTFQQGDLIYRKVTCGRTETNEVACRVKPVICQKASCQELMFAHATDMYPSRFYWYQQSDGNYTCTPVKPARNVPYTMCNRVEALPLFNYLTNYQFGSYWYMNTPSILGVHVEKLITSLNQ